MLLDTSVVIEIFRHKKASKFFQEVMRKVGGEAVFVSIIELAEIADWCVQNSIPAQIRISAVSDFAQIIPVDEGICEEAATIKKGGRAQGYSDFGLIDSIILASARAQNQEVLTLDSDFDGEKDCLILKLK